MIILRRGDRLPTVTVLQSYLNQQASTGEYLAVDGILGPRTEAAVRRFCTSSGIGRGGVVDYEVWRGVVGAEWQIMDSVDRSDHDSPKHSPSDHEDLAPYGQTLLEQFGLSRGGAYVLNQVHAHARYGQVVLLRFHGHGSPGNMIVSSGRTSISSFDYRFGEKFFSALMALRPIFAPFGSVEMHGCRVAQGLPGRTLLSNMANSLGVPVSAGTTTQWGGGGRSTFRFEGPTLTMCPNGQSLQNWSRQVGTASVLRP